MDDQFAETISGFLDGAGGGDPSRRVAEKTPANVLHFPTLRQLFPESPLVAVVRDGRDVVASLLGCDWTDARTGRPMDIVVDPAAAARLWLRSVEASEAMACDPRLHVVRYEALVASPGDALEALFNRLGEPFDAAALDHARVFDPAAGQNETSAARVSQPLDTASVGRWRRDLTRDQLRTVEAVIAPALDRLGYE
jgi:hypothetical protein